MKIRYKLIGILLALLFLSVVVFSAWISFRALMGTVSAGEEGVSLSLPVPLLIAFAAIPFFALLLAFLLVLRSVSRIRRREAAERKENREEEDDL